MKGKLKVNLTALLKCTSTQDNPQITRQNAKAKQNKANQMTSRSFKSLFCNQNVRKTEKWNMNGQLTMKKKEIQI